MEIFTEIFTEKIPPPKGKSGGGHQTIRTTSMSARNIALIAVISIFMVPAIWLNIQFGQFQGRSTGQIVAMVMCVIAAAYAAAVIEHTKSSLRRFIATSAMLMFASVNIANSLGLIAEGRNLHVTQTSAEKRRSASVSEGLRRLRAEVSRRLAEVSAETPRRFAEVSAEALEGEILARQTSEIWRRSKHCQDITLSETAKWCGDLQRLRGKLAATKRLATLRRELSAKEAQARTMTPPKHVDAQAEGLAILFGVTPDTAGLANDAILALCVELMAILAPLFFSWLFPLPIQSVVTLEVPAETPKASEESPRRVAEPPKPPKKTRKPPKKESEIPETLEAVIASYAPCDGDGVRASDIGKCCAAAGIDISHVALSSALKEAGFKKYKGKGGVIFWRVKPRPVLRVVGE